MSTEEVEELRKEIARLTDELPESTDPKYLRSRIAELHKNAFFTVSVNRAQRNAIVKHVDPFSVGRARGARNMSAFVRKALVHYLRLQGDEHAAKLLEEVG